MKKEFDFDKIGKQTSYKVPGGFFDEITSRTLEKAKERERRAKIRRIYTAVSVAASLLIVISVALFLKTGRPDIQPENVVVVQPAEPEKPVVDSIETNTTEPVQPKKEAEMPMIEKPETLDHLLTEMTDEELVALANDLSDELFVDELTTD